MRKNSGSSLFLMELILAILIFSLASTVCVRLFVSAHLLSRNSQDINRGILWSQNLAEIYLSPEGSVEKIEELFPDKANRDGTKIELYFDKDWNNISVSEAQEMTAYSVSLTELGQENGIQNAVTCVVAEDGDAGTILEIPLKKHID